MGRSMTSASKLVAMRVKLACRFAKNRQREESSRRNLEISLSPSDVLERLVGNVCVAGSDDSSAATVRFAPDCTQSSRWLRTRHLGKARLRQRQADRTHLPLLQLRNSRCEMCLRLSSDLGLLGRCQCAVQSQQISNNSGDFEGDH